MPGEGLNPVTGGVGRNAGVTCLLPQAEDGALGSDPVLSRDELDALLGEVWHSGDNNRQSLSTG